jgi:hypothetical protein
MLSQLMVYETAYSHKIVREAVLTDLDYENSGHHPSGSSPSKI